MKKRYIKPEVVRHSVQMESPVLAASVVNQETMSEVKTTGHELNEVGIGTETWNNANWE